MDALRHASTFAGRDEARTDLSTIRFGREGHIVSTDARRLFVYQSPTNDWLEFVIEAQAARDLQAVVSATQSAQLHLEGKTAELAYEGSKSLFSLVEAAPLDWQKVVPTSYSVRVTAPQKVWAQEIDELIRFWENAVPEVSTSESFDRIPKAVLLFSPATKRVSIEVE
jgi:DNA polymerase III sliding clamp (beta) subunit (PCNA family)